MSQKLLERLNNEYVMVHKEYERLYWISYMGDKTVDADFTEAKAQFNNFRESRENKEAVEQALEKETDEKIRARLQYWKDFFILYQIPEDMKALRSKITLLENDIRTKQAGLKTGYTDPETGDWKEIPVIQMSLMIATEPNEALRKACFLGKNEAARATIKEYMELVGLRNEYARGLGFDDFYAYKARIEEQMKSSEIFKIFDDLSEVLIPFCTQRLKEMELSQKGLRAPWNTSYMIAGDFTREEDQYFPLETTLDTWGRSFAALGIDYRGGTLRLDLLERKLKYNNGFCHAPVPVHYIGEKRIPGETNFTCNAMIGQVGSGYNTGNTLFHEGGHAAHFLGMDMEDVCLNTEYPAMSTAWAETQSMFLDTLFSSIEWKMRYAKNLKGESYPFSLYEKKLQKTFLLEPLQMLRMASVIDFERQIYASKNLGVEEVQKIAEEVSIKYNNYDSPSLYLLGIPHIYSWSASCAYHGYALATLALTQWRDYLYEKYGYLVDNSAIGQEMAHVWKFGSSLGFSELVQIATGKPLSPEAFLKEITLGEEGELRSSKERLQVMENVPTYEKTVNLGAEIFLLNGKEVITSNKESFETMCREFREYIEKRKAQ